MSLREDLDALSGSYLQTKTARAKVRQEVKAIRAEEDNVLGRQHALEDIPTIVANIKQAAVNGVQEYEFEIDQSLEVYTTPYAQGYYEAIKAFMNDHNVGLYTTNKTMEGSRITTHSLFIYWR